MARIRCAGPIISAADLKIIGSHKMSNDKFKYPIGHSMLSRNMSV